MEIKDSILQNDERAALKLRALYEGYGHSKYKVSKFEEYALYMENKNFVRNDHIITFNDLHGKLLALKPDITLSIAKNADVGMSGVSRLYYNENVYRLNRNSLEYKEISQLGLELIGQIDLYLIGEVVGLAAKSLDKIGRRFLLDISHMEFIRELIESLDVDDMVVEQVLNCIRSKNAHVLKSVCEKNNISIQLYNKLAALTKLSGPFAKTLDKAFDICIKSKMENALKELKKLWQMLGGVLPGNVLDSVHLDFSIINDMDYYNGIIFQGYIEGLSRAVLSGGRYDNLMKKFNKNCGAVGFAVYLDELDSLDYNSRKFDFDTIILYNDSTDFTALSKKAAELVDGMERVLVVKKLPDGIRYSRVLDLSERGDI